MKKIMILCVLALSLISCDQKTCESDNQAYCEVLEIQDYEIEENASIKIGVLDERYGQLIIDSLDDKIKDVYAYEVIAEDSDLKSFDVIQTMVEDVPLMYDYLLPIQDEFNDLLSNEFIYKHSKDVNQVENYFMPVEIKGILFAYNKTYLEAIGVNVGDNTQGLPESFDSFEKIGALAKTLKDNNAKYLDEPMTQVFSFPFNDQSSMISFIENSDYRLIQGIKGEDLNVGDDLLEALQAFQSLGVYPWNFDEEANKTMVWNYEEALTKQTSPFMLVGNWMFYEQFQQSQAFELVFTKLPSLNGYDLETSSSVSGFVLNKESEFPNAQHQFLKQVKSLKGLDALIEAQLIPIVDPLMLEVLENELDPNLKQQIIAYTHSHAPELHAFEKNPSIKSYNIYYDVDFREIWRSLFIGEIDAKTAQKNMVEKIDKWLEEHELTREKEHDLETDHTEGTK